jgi:hypothetical protein
MDSYEEREYPWSGEAWEKAREAALNDTEPRRVLNHPVILTPDGPISSASKLQQLAETATVPEAIVTSLVRRNGQEIGKVTICSLDWEDWMTMHKKADLATSTAKGNLVIFEGKQRLAFIVTALKEGVTLENGKDGNDEGGS